MEQPEHLVPNITDRGFKHMPPIPSSYGGFVRIYESSSAEEPKIWLLVECPEDLNKPNGDMKEAVAHLTFDEMCKLHEQIGWMLNNHYLRPSSSGPSQELNETVVYHQGKKYVGENAFARALDGDEPDDYLEIEVDPDAPPKKITTVHVHDHPIHEVSAMLEMWGRMYPNSVAIPAEDGWEIWTKSPSGDLNEIIFGEG